MFGGDEILARRKFLEFMGRGAVALSAAPILAPLLSSCAGAGKRSIEALGGGLVARRADELSLADGLRYSLIVKWKDPIGTDLRFGSHNDYLAFFPIENRQDDGLLWSNHEYLSTLFCSGIPWGQAKNRKKAEVLREQEEVGGSIVRVRRDPATGEWRMVADDPLNRRITARTRIPFAWPEPVQGARAAIGTLGNCAGGVTPWKTVLTCEEQFVDFYGEREWHDGKPGKVVYLNSYYGWETVFPYPPEHYGWVVEVNPFTGAAQKLVALGRFGHECATVRVASDGRCVVYSGDDDTDRCLYKFIADKPGSLESGKLYAADTANGRWLPLDWSASPILKKNFRSQLDVLIRAREAALMAGATPLDRPEDIEIDPATGSVIVSLTNNTKKKNYFGSILRLSEKGNDPLSLEFDSGVLISGGPETGFACPDNLAFDRRGNLWFTSDISGTSLGKKPYEPFGNNSLFVVPMSGGEAGRPIRVANAPMDAEFTGPMFTHDGRTLFLSVQHPGEMSPSLDNLTSHWPEGGSALPKSAVVAISGPLLDKLVFGSISG